MHNEDDYRIPVYSLVFPPKLLHKILINLPTMHAACPTKPSNTYIYIYVYLISFVVTSSQGEPNLLAQEGNDHSAFPEFENV